MPLVDDQALHPIEVWSQVLAATPVEGTAGAALPHPVPPPKALMGEATAALTPPVTHPAPLPVLIGDATELGVGIGVKELTSHEGSHEGGDAPPVHLRL